MKKLKLLLSLIPAALMGCSVTTLQCGVDGDSSYVITKISEVTPQTAKTMAELCNFKEKLS